MARIYTVVKISKKSCFAANNINISIYISFNRTMISSIISSERMNKNLVMLSSTLATKRTTFCNWLVCNLPFSPMADLHTISSLPTADEGAWEIKQRWNAMEQQFGGRLSKKQLSDHYYAARVSSKKTHAFKHVKAVFRFRVFHTHVYTHENFKSV